jgi:nucleotide-binding universal stress UspA family protein
MKLLIMRFILPRTWGWISNLLYVFEPPMYPPVGRDLQVPSVVHQWITGLKEDASKSLNSLTDAAQRMDIKVHSIFKEGEPFEEILKVAEEITADLIVLGSHGRKGLDKFLIGSVAERVMRKAPCPVFLVRGKAAQAISPNT